MNEKVNQFCKGNFIYETPKLILSEKEINIRVCAGSIYHGNFTIRNNKNTVVKGILRSTNPLIKLKKEKFIGVSTELEYEVNGTKIESGHRLSEKIIIITDCGEDTLAVNVHIINPFIKSSIGIIKDMDAFAGLAKQNWEKALSIFISKEFHSYLLADNKNLAPIYEQLMKSKSKNYALEEFLISAKKKEPIKFKVKDKSLIYEISNGDTREELLISRDHWGHIEILASSDSPFISIKNKRITSQSFINDNYFLEFVIKAKNMHRGKNFGRIYLKTNRQEIIIEIRASLKEDQSKNNYTRSREKEYQVGLAKTYFNYVIQGEEKEQYLSQTSKILEDIERLPIQDADSYLLNLCHLYRAYLMLLYKEEKKGQDFLRELKAKKKVWKKNNKSLYWFYIAIKALYLPEDDRGGLIKSIEKYYQEEGQSNWWILWLLIQLKSESLNNNKLVLNEINKQFYRGMNSPYLYFEALKILNNNPDYLMKLDSFEIQLMFWAAKNKRISKGLARQFIYLASKEKAFQRLTFKVLEYIYHEFKLLEGLHALCSLLIKGHKGSTKYFKWYELGVAENLRVTELYEYYMQSLDESMDLVLPKSILLYFLYSNTLSEHKRSFLYAYIIKRKTQIPQIYQRYLKKMETYGLDQLKKENINWNLVTIYEEFFLNSNLLKDYRYLLWNLVFTYEIQLDNPNIKGIIVLYKEKKDSLYIPLKNGKAQIKIYNKDTTFFFVDNWDNIIGPSIEYKKSNLMNIDQLNDQEIILEKAKIGTILYINQKINNHLEDKIWLETKKTVLELPNIKEDFYIDNLLSIIFYYYKHKNYTMLDNYLDKLPYIPRYEKTIKVIEILIERKFYDKAFHEIKNHGYKKIDLIKLLQLCEYIIKQKAEDIDIKEEPILLYISYYCFTKGKYNQDTLKYLSDYFQGTCQQIYEIWDVAKEFSVDTKAIEERFLGQILFTESWQLNSYPIYKSNIKSNPITKISKAFITYQAYLYLVKEIRIDSRYFKHMEKLVAFEKNDFCCLALLKYYSTLEILEEDQVKLIYRFTMNYIKDGIILPFFKKFKEVISIPYDFIYKTFVEIKTDTHSRVTISYQFMEEGKNEEPLEYITEEMQEVFPGIFVKGFQIFFGERVQYFVTITNPDGTKNSTKEMALELEEGIKMNEDGFYNHLNYMKKALSKRDNKAFIDSYEKFLYKDYMVSKEFKPIF